MLGFGEAVGDVVGMGGKGGESLHFYVHVVAKRFKSAMELQESEASRFSWGGRRQIVS